MKYSNTRWYILLFFVILSLGISIFSLVLSLSDVKIEQLSFSWDKTETIIEILISSIGIVITGYFVVLAVNAYSHVKQINENLAKSEEIIKKNECHVNSMKLIAKNYADSFFEDISDRIASENSDTQERKRLILRRARLILNFTDFSYGIFRNVLDDLAELGNNNDCIKLRKKLEELTEEKRDYAEFIVEYMEKRLAGELG